MAKSIVICSDGTGNIANKNRGTNVFKLFEAVDLNGHRMDPDLTPQVALYDDGVGTESFKPLKLLGGAFGFGLGRNVRQLYKELSRIYDEGDQIYLFGFSRGAFTVRSLAGMIATCGIIDAASIPEAGQLHANVKREYRQYRRCYVTALQKLFGRKPARITPDIPREKYRVRASRVRFVGVWDTVDAVGLPFHLGDLYNNLISRYKFPDRKLSSKVDQACHALSIDDERETFAPVLWDELDENGEKDDRIEQVWFAGAHSNVGGGYPKQGMALVALDWMMAKARLAGLRFIPFDEELYRDHGNVDDKLYDPRAGAGVFYRWKPRNIANLCETSGIRNPLVHMSALERVAHGTEDYAPGNLRDGSRVTYTPQIQKSREGLLKERAAALEEVIGKRDINRLPSVRGAIAVGLLSYYLFLASCFYTVFALALGGDFRGLWRPFAALGSVGMLLWSAVTGQWMDLWAMAGPVAEHPTVLSLIVAGFGFALLLSIVADRIMSATFSNFWHKLQQPLRTALKGARKSYAAKAGTRTSTFEL